MRYLITHTTPTPVHETSFSAMMRELPDNPAYALLEILTNPAFGYSYALTDLDLDAFARFAAFCDAPVTWPEVLGLPTSAWEWD